MAFWWNPVAWWARRNLRANEEICCDALVLSRLHPQPRSYARSLVNAIEFLSTPALRPPAMASEIDSGGVLERRIEMIVSKKPSPTTPRWLSAIVLLGAVVLMPLGVAYAQDYDAVGKRLREAVAAGELTGEQARIMMDALRKSTLKDKGDVITREHYAEVAEKLKKAVEAGEVSEEHARQRLEEMRKHMATPGEREHANESRRITREEYARIEAELKKLVEVGKITSDDMRKRLERARQMIGRKHAEEMDWERIRRRIEGAVSSGKMTREEANAKYEELKKEEAARRVRAEQERKLREDYQAFERRIKAAVESGKMTEEEAKKALDDYRHRLGERAEHSEKTDRTDEKRRALRAKYAAIEKEIQALVEAGKLTPEEAEQKLVEARKRLFGDR